MNQGYRRHHVSRSGAAAAATLGFLFLGFLPVDARQLQGEIARHSILPPSSALSAPGTANVFEREARLQVHLVPLREALDALQVSSGVPVAYSSRFLPEDRLVSCDCAHLSVREAIARLLDGTNLEAVVASDQVVVRARTSSPPPFVPPVTQFAAVSFEPTLPSPANAIRAPRRESSPARLLRQGTVTGRVAHADTGEGIGAVQISVQGTGLGVVSGADGAFTITNVPAGTHTIVAQRLGFQPLQQGGVIVTSGEVTTLNLAMRPQVLALQEIVATGLVDPVEGVRSPIAVGRLTREMMPTTVSGAAVQNLQGRMAGVRINRTSGQPGSDVNIVLRTPTSLRGETAPLIVVDGVILQGTSTSDIESMDIESIEVIRGAAASSLYGSRASSGVIAITTARGRGLEQGQTRFSARSEIGVSQNMRDIRFNNSHQYLMDPTNSFYVDQDGQQVTRANRVAPPDAVAFIDRPFPGQVYDNVAAITRPGSFQSHSASVSGNTATTNFAISVTNFQEEGSLVGNRGYQRNAFRINLDHRFLDALSMGVSMYHARNTNELLAVNAFDLALQAPRDVDLRVKDDNGNFLQQPDPGITYQNPLWTNATRENDSRGTRTLANLSIQFAPLSWLSASGSVGYDRSESETRNYVPKGTPRNLGTTGFWPDGSISFNNDDRDTWNVEGQVTLRRDFGLLNVRTTVRGLVERDDQRGGTRSAENFILSGIPQINNTAQADRNATSSQQEIRATGYLWDTAFDYDGKYVLTVLGRRDGSSLFGRENRWHNYYRLAGAWRLGEEDWFNIPRVTEFKISAARGTAGGRPAFDHQYETWTLTGGVPTKGNLGNTQLRPEHTTENEVSLNVIAFENRVGLVVTHARQTTSDLLNPGPLPAITGYNSQWVNAGTIAGHSTEVELETQLVQQANLGWTSVFVFDYSNARITDWTIPCYTQAWLFNCQDIPVYGLYSRWLLKSRAQLNQHLGGAAVDRAHEFQVNDEGFLVWVGEGNNYWEGLEKNLWGTTTTIAGVVHHWGTPFYERLPDGNAHRTLLGEGTAAHFGWMNNLRLGSLNLHAHLHMAIGGQANNRRHQLMGRTPDPATAPYLDQAGKRDELKKTIRYFREAEGGDATYNVEDASYLKLRTLSASYPLSQSHLAAIGLGGLGVQSLSIGLVMRNVFTITNYQGFDPEGALNLNSRANSDTSGYPPTRSLTAEISVTF